MECDHIFNLFSCYGYVLRIKIFRTKADHALVQMATSQQANTAVAALKGVEVFGKKLSVNFSRHTNINATDSTDHLTRDYSKTNLNRFPLNVALTTNVKHSQNGTSILAANSNGLKKNRFMCHPTHTIHISNLDASVEMDELEAKFKDFGEIEGVRAFEHNNKCMALIKFKLVPCAVAALCTLHNQLFKSLPMKISFSTNKL